MPRILVIDDNLELCEMLRVVLMSAGHSVQTASGGDEGIRLFQKTPADLVVTDILMPKRNGLETIVELKGTHPKLKIVAMSGGFLKENVKENDLAEAMGVDGILAKPIDPEHLVEVVADVLGRKR